MYFFTKLYIFFILLALNIFFFSTIKVEANSFEVKDIEISKPFENNFDKNKVIDEGFDKAFIQLINTLIKSSDLSKIENVKLNEIKSMVNSFSIKEEKFIDKTYFVNLGVSFNKKKIFNFFEKKNIFPSQIIREKFLFIPIIIDEEINNLNLFSNNQIYDNWIDISKKYHLINYVLPTEDLEDLALIKKNIETIENYNFEEIIKKYLVNNCIIALIFNNKDGVRVLSKIITNDKMVIKNDTFSKFDFKDKQKIEFLIDQLKITYEDTWKINNEINTSIKLPLNIRLNNDNSERLLKFEKVLNELDLISDFSIKKFDKKHIFYEIVFNGTSINFINIMKKNNYKFNTEKKIWILK